LSFVALLMPLAVVCGRQDGPRPAAASTSDGVRAADKAASAPAVSLDELAKQVAGARRAVASLSGSKAAWPKVVVNGVEVPEAQIQRLALYVGGRQLVVALQRRILVDAELERRKKAGLDVASLAVPESEVKRRVDKSREELEASKPDTTWDDFLATSDVSEEGYAWIARTQCEFDAAFFPTKYDDAPDSTKAFVEQMTQKDPQKIAAQWPALSNPNPPVEQRLGVMLLKMQFFQKQLDAVVLKDATDGIPADAGFVGNGIPLKTAELLNGPLGGIGPTALEQAIQFAAIQEAVKQALRKREESDFAKAKEEVAKRRAAGETVEDAKRPVYWLEGGSPEWTAAFDVDKGKYPAVGPFNYQGSILNFRAFPTMAFYKSFLQCLASYERASKDERRGPPKPASAPANGSASKPADATARVDDGVAPEKPMPPPPALKGDTPLEKYIERNKRFLTHGQTNCELILYGADDAKAGSNAARFDAARKRAEKGIADIKEGARRADEARAAAKKEGKGDAEVAAAASAAAKGLTFAEVLDRDSDFPAAIPGLPPDQQQNRGRIGSRMLNPLIKILGESELTHVLQGYSVAEYLFFDAPVGKVVGPLRAPKGYYVARVIARTPGAPGAAAVTALAPGPIAEEDFLNHSFRDFVNDVVAHSKIEIR